MLEMNHKMTATAKRILVVGLGKTGLSVVRYLDQQDVDLAVTDTRARPSGLPGFEPYVSRVAAFLNGFDQQAFASADEIIVSPGVSLAEPLLVQARQEGIPIYGDIELFIRNAQAPIIAITGSNGKSTVTSMLAVMGRQAGRQILAGGNLGTPALELLSEPVPDFYVLELSSFQLESTPSLNACAAVVLNISADHMDRYDSLGDYADIKERIYQGDGVQVINDDDIRVVAMAACAQPGRKHLHFTMATPADKNTFGLLNAAGEDWLAQGQHALMPVTELRVRGRHNVANALAALALGSAAGFTEQAMLQALRKFPGLPHRSQYVATINQVDWYNDSKGTNPGATKAAIEGMPGSVVLIAGGESKGADFSSLREVASKKLHAAVLIGRDAAVLADALQDVTQVVFAENMEQAVVMAAELARAGDDVLLSPACASFDMYQDYQQRGDDFVECVRALQQEFKP
ncbi:MAG TPA: UDP-N-acetylmuramoyl-L-alanine--D-glutamate ligase [Gammaproteobacteria bacterium]|nr:UDP-N-acetylmuramoyl-L-alanine--D-glutamate ligase [Gammaproteobacteria bacterium]